jgi:hypothetical protein
MDRSATEFAAHKFSYDGATLDHALAHFIQKFYTLLDDQKSTDAWAACFTETAVMTEATIHIAGRQGT